MANSLSSRFGPAVSSQEDLLYWLVTSPAVWLETLTELNGQPFQCEPYQLRFLNDRSTFRLVNKSRQIGFSTIIAAEGIHKAAISRFVGEPYKANFVSINQVEAADKIEIARNLYHSIPDQVGEELKPVLWTDSETEISLHRPPYVSTLVSQPASAAIRGGRKDIYFDEFAHIRDAKKLYQAAIPAISRGNSRLTIVSTPLGQSGLFYDIAVDSTAYPQYSRHAVPWWECSAMVRDGYYEEALALAAGMTTPDRVKAYGTDKLRAIYDSFGSDLIGFQTEYEATFVDETTSYFPWDLIISVTEPEEVLPLWRDWPPGYESPGYLTIGVDLAKERDQSVFTVAEHTEKDGEQHKWTRFIKSTQDSYDEQFSYLRWLIKQTKPVRVTIDQTGVGQVFVERAKRELGFPGTLIEGVVFTNQKKEKWATTLKGEMQLGQVHFLRHQDLLRQTHAIRRTKTEANFYKFSAPHDDFFWSNVLAYYGEGRVPARISFL